MEKSIFTETKHFGNHKNSTDQQSREKRYDLTIDGADEKNNANGAAHGNATA